MYEVFDSFLGVDTWHTTHPNDDERFYRALNSVVRERAFNPDVMAEYFREFHKVRSQDEENDFHQAIDRRRDSAWSIADFVRTVEPLPWK